MWRGSAFRHRARPRAEDALLGKYLRSFGAVYIVEEGTAETAISVALIMATTHILHSLIVPDLLVLSRSRCDRLPSSLAHCRVLLPPVDRTSLRLVVCGLPVSHSALEYGNDVLCAELMIEAAGGG